MATKRRKFFALVLLAVVGGGIAYWLLNRSDEPEYQGRRLSEWCELRSKPQLLRTDSNQVSPEDALRAIGTNGLPYYLKWTDYKPSASRRNFHRKLPRFLADRKIIKDWLWQAGAHERASWAQVGFILLGTNAASAIPQLEAWMNDKTETERALRATYALGAIGEAAVPVLMTAAVDAQPDSYEAVILRSFRLMRLNHSANAYLPKLHEALKHNDPVIRSTATNLLRWLDP